MGLDRHFGEIRIPTENIIEIKDGKKVPTIQRQFPGYVLVNMDMNDTTWQLVRQTPGVTQIVGAGEKPLALSRTEVERLLHPGGVETREKVKTTVEDRKSTRLNSSHANISYAVFCLKKKQ